MLMFRNMLNAEKKKILAGLALEIKVQLALRAKIHTVKRGNFDRQGNFDRSGTFVKGAMVLIQKSLFVASAFMEINK